MMKLNNGVLVWIAVVLLGGWICSARANAVNDVRKPGRNSLIARASIRDAQDKSQLLVYAASQRKPTRQSSRHLPPD